MEAVVKLMDKSLPPAVASSFAKAGRAAARVFGCRHRNMSRPFTRDGETYRACLGCGARRRFDVERWETVGPHYHPPRPARALEAETR